MTPEATELLAACAAAFGALDDISRDVFSYDSLDDDVLLYLARSAASMQRLASTHTALIAGVLAKRSAHDLGSSGLAQRNGYRTPAELVRVTTGSTLREAATAVQVGTLALDSAAIPDAATGVIPVPRQPWLRAVAAALVANELSVAAAESIRNGLGEPSAEITIARLADAATQLCSEAARLDADRLFRRARELRDELDEAGIADREAAARAKRSFTFKRLPDGMARAIWTLDPESAAVVGELYDRATSPRRGGPRFVSADAVEVAEHISTDDRTTEQLASDVFAELLRQGAAADSSQLLGSGAPVVRVLVTADALAESRGHGRIEGQPTPVSIETVERLACAGSSQEVMFDSFGRALDVGREQRLFTPKQRVALAARDGGCMWEGCERPPSWTEAHHISHWARDGGGTDVANGILLCRHHHLLLHNNRWEITGGQGQYWLTPPPDVDPNQTPRLMPSKSAALRDLLRSA